ncbi:MAG TPA: DUF1501 domain-containing protein [Planctomycetota bacterium]
MTLTRRQLVVAGLRVGLFVPLALRARAAPARETAERVLVVLQLTGGNDGLNTVVPHRQDAYYRLRPTLALPRSKLHALDDEHGLHPALGALQPVRDAGRLTVVHGVGYPEPDRSHFRSLEVWHGADPRGTPHTGWLGRMADRIAARSGGMPALCVDDGELPLALVGERVFAPALPDESSLALATLPGLAAGRESAGTVDHDATGDLAFLRAAARASYEAAGRLEQALARGSSADYPDSPLARRLRLVARLVTGGFDTRIFHLSLGGFDTHAHQAAAHAALLETLARALAAFEADLAASGAEERVLTLVHGEFGRRAAENGSRGTDHGAAAPVLLLGAPGGGGPRGTPPDLNGLVDGDVPFTTDFRALYSAIEQDWMGLERTLPVAPFPLR